MSEKDAEEHGIKVKLGKLRSDKVPVYVYEVNEQTGLQTIDIGGVKSEIHPDLLKGALFDKWDGMSIENIPIQGGTRKIEGNIQQQGYQKATDTIKEGTKEKLIEATVYGTGAIKKEVKTTEGTKTTEVTTFSDNTLKTVIKDKGSMQSIIYTKGDIKVEVSTAVDNFPTDPALEQRLIQAAFDAGIKKIDNYDNGFKQGDTRIYLDSNNIIYNVKSDVLITSYSESGARSTYESVKWDTKENKPIFQKGSRIITKTGDNLDEISEYTADNDYLKYKYTINDDEVKDQISIYKGGTAYLGTLFLDPVDIKYEKDQNYKFNGMYPLRIFDDDGVTIKNNVYIKTTSGPFRLFGAKYIGDDGKELTSDQIKELNLPDIKQLERGFDEAFIAKSVSTPAQSSSQSFFAGVERIFSEFSGLRYYDTLFFKEDELLKWRDNVDRAFATFYLGTEYWSSALCSQYLDGEDEGIAYAETPQGLAQIGAHVEAIRTGAVQTATGTEFIYSITFSIRNGDFANDPRAPNEMNFNVILRGERTSNVFSQEQKVKRGSTFSRTGKDAIVQESPVFYSQVCIRFDEIPLRWKLDDKELCNTIVESTGQSAPLAASSGAAASSGGTGATESGINDF